MRRPGLVVLLLVAAVLAGCDSVSSSPAQPTPTSASLPSPTSTIGIVDASTPTPTSLTSQFVTVVITIVPTVIATPSSGADAVTADAAVVRQHSFVPSTHPAATPDGAGNTLYAFHGTCKGSGDGYCQQMFFFLGSTYLGTDTSAPSMAIISYHAAGEATIAVTYANYASGDPLCCPSGSPVTITYHWDGHRLVPSGTPPGH